MPDSAGFGVHIAGFGRDTSKTKGAMFYDGSPPPDTGYEALAVMASTPSSLSVSVEELEGRPNAGGASFGLDYRYERAGDPAYGLVDSLISPSRARTETIEGTSRSQTTLTLSDAGLAGDVIWVNAEAILLGTHDGGGTYSGCDRGFYGTEQQGHADGSWVHQRPHLVRGAMVTFWEWEDGLISSMRPLWPGYIQRAKIGRGGTTVEVTARGILSVQWDSQVGLNRGEKDRDQYALDYSLSNTNARNPVINGRVRGVTEVGMVSTWEANGRARALQVGDGLIFEADQRVNQQLAQLGSSFDVDFDDVEDESRIWAPADALRKPIRGGVREVAAFGRLLSEASLDPTYGVEADVVPTQDGSHPHHPVTLAMALLMYVRSPTDDASPGFYGFLQRPWTLGAVSLFSVAIGDADRIIDELPWVEIDHLILGWDGEPTDVWEIVNGALLNPIGVHWGMQTNAKPNLTRYRFGTIDDYVNASVLDPIDPPSWDPTHSEQQVEIEGEAGALPWDDEGVPVRWEVDGVDLPKIQTGGTRSHTYDFRAYRAGTAKELGARLAGKTILEYFTPPNVGVRVESPGQTGADIDIGSWVLLGVLAADPPWAPDPDAGDGRTNDLTAERYIGRVRGWTYNVEDRTYTVDLRLMNFDFGQVVRWRAPSMRVTDADETVTPRRYYCPATSDYGAPGPDNEEFEVGDQIVLHDKNLGVVEGGRSIASIGSDANGDFVTLDFPFTNTPTLGEDVMTVADYDTYDNGSAHLSGATRVYVFFADAANTTLGAAGDAAMIYGL